MSFTHKLNVIKSIALRRPIMAVWNITDNCNFSCLYCNSHAAGAKPPPLNELVATLKLMKEIGIRYLFLQGGEPTMHESIVDIMDEIIKHGIKPTLITNGSFLNDKIINFIRSRDINLSISLPTLCPETHFGFTGVNNLAHILDKIKKLKDIQRKGSWSITTTVTQMNLATIDDIEAFAVENNFMYAIRSYMFNIGNFGKADQKLEYNNKFEIISIFEKFARQEYSRNFFAYLVYKEEIKYLSGNYLTPCDAIKYSLNVNSDGSFSPCIELNAPSNRVKEQTADQTISALHDQLACVKDCYSFHPCFHGCARNIGIILNNKKLLARNPFRIIKSLFFHGSFF